MNSDATLLALHVIVIDEIDVLFRKRSSVEDSGDLKYTFYGTIESVALQCHRWDAQSRRRYCLCVCNIGMGKKTTGSEESY